MMITRGIDIAHLITPQVPGTYTRTLSLCRSCFNREDGNISLQSTKAISNPAHTDVINDTDFLSGVMSALTNVSAG